MSISTLFRYDYSNIKIDNNGKTFTTEYTPPSEVLLVNTEYYRWKESDRIDQLSFKLFGNCLQWWRIMDLNPYIYDPFDILPGQIIVIPKVT